MRNASETMAHTLLLSMFRCIVCGKFKVQGNDMDSYPDALPNIMYHPAADKWSQNTMLECIISAPSTSVSCLLTTPGSRELPIAQYLCIW